MLKLEQLQQNLQSLLKERILECTISFEQLTITVAAETLHAVMHLLCNDATTKFEQCVDLCGVDYSMYSRVDNVYHYDPLEDTAPAQTFISKISGKSRFAVVYHLLSCTHNWRLRVRVFAQDNEMPMLDSVSDIWSSANWYEREAFDMYGILFNNHPDLRRILTDYGFIGHPFRKDFPLSGHMEMIYDEEQKRVVYQPVTIEPREVVPRVIREENYGNLVATSICK